MQPEEILLEPEVMWNSHDGGALKGTSKRDLKQTNKQTKTPDAAPDVSKFTQWEYCTVCFFSSKYKNAMHSKVICALPFYDGYIWRFMFTFFFQHSHNEKRPCLDKNFCVFSCLEIEGGEIFSLQSHCSSDAVSLLTQS